MIVMGELGVPTCGQGRDGVGEWCSGTEFKTTHVYFRFEDKGLLMAYLACILPC